MTTRTPPTCTDCRWYGEPGRPHSARCGHPDTMAFDLIRGAQRVEARTARGAASECGPDGNLWEPVTAPPWHGWLRSNGVALAIILFLAAAFWMR